MASGREIKTKIKSTQNMRKVTRALEMVSASKIRKAQELMKASRPYARLMRKVIAHVAQASTDFSHPFLIQREKVARVAYVVVSTDRGLCGGLNVNLFKRLAVEMRAKAKEGVEIDLCAIGQKGAMFFRNYGGNVVSALTHIGDAPSANDLIGAVKVMLDAYGEGRIDRLFLVNNRFVNTMTQTPEFTQLLPLKPVDKDEFKHHWDYLYEPDAKPLLDGLLTRFVESQVYQGVVENLACEQAARMIAMKSATDNAGDIIKDLQLAYNKARQAAITQEISEIVSGAAAV